MSRRIAKWVAVSVTAVLVAVIAANAIGPGPGPAHAATNKGWCVREGPTGDVEYLRQDTSHSGVGLLTGRRGMEEHCDEKHDGAAWMSDKQKDRVEGAGNVVVGLPPLTDPDQFPANEDKTDWFQSPKECSALPSTNDSTNNNRLQHVYSLRTIELGLQIAYDVGSNEITGITGAILGVILGTSKVATYVTEWNYDLQDECQEILERRQIADISVDTEQIVGDVKTLLARVDVAVSSRATQTSVDDVSTDVGAVNTKVMEISTTLGALGASLTTETDEIDAALATLATSLTTETDEIDAALDDLSLQLGAAQDQSVRLYIEDHLDTCRPLASLLLADPAGLLPLTVLVVDDLANRAEAVGLNIGSARLALARANDSIVAGNPREGFLNLCTAYEQIVRGGRR